MDAFSLAMAGYSSTTAVLEILRNFAKEENYTYFTLINYYVLVSSMK